MYGQFGVNTNLGGYSATYGQGANGYGAAAGAGAAPGAMAGPAGGYGGAPGAGRGAPSGAAAAGAGDPAGAATTGYTGAYPRGQTQHEFVEGKIFLGGLPGHTTKASLIEYCQQWGELSDHVLMEGRGFGFVTFSDPASAQSFLEHKEHVIDNKRCEAKAAVRSADNNNSLTRKMFVGGTGEVKDEDFRTYFEQFGHIEDCVVLRRPDGISRGFGFVTYADETSVEKCLVMRHVLNGKQVELKRALSKDRPPPGANAGWQSGGSGAGGGAGGPMRNGKQPDWVCAAAECKNKNFGWRSNCNRCHLPKPNNPEFAPATRPPTGGAASYGAARPSFDASQPAANPAADYGAPGPGYEAPTGGPGYGAAAAGAGYGGMGMGMQGMGAYGMGAYGLGGMGGGPMGLGGGAMGMGAGAMGGAMGAGGMGMNGGYAGNAGAYGQGDEGYGRQAGRGGGPGARYRPY